MVAKRVNSTNRATLAKIAANEILLGNLVIAKADTSYTILSMPNHPKAKKSLSEIKNGRGNKLYSLFYHNKSSALSRVSRRHLNIANQILPGEVTIIVSKKEPAIRFIEKPTISAILQNVRHPVTATSANPSEMPPAININMIKKYFDDTDLLVLYEGIIPKILPSTIIDLTSKDMQVLRQGRLKVDKYLS